MADNFGGSTQVRHHAPLLCHVVLLLPTPRTLAVPRRPLASYTMRSRRGHDARLAQGNFTGFVVSDNTVDCGEGRCHYGIEVGPLPVRCLPLPLSLSPPLPQSIRLTSATTPPVLLGTSTQPQGVHGRFFVHPTSLATSTQPQGVHGRFFVHPRALSPSRVLRSTTCPPTCLGAPCLGTPSLGRAYSSTLMAGARLRALWWWWTTRLGESGPSSLLFLGPVRECWFLISNPRCCCAVRAPWCVCACVAEPLCPTLYFRAARLVLAGASHARHVGSISCF
jgi:hypothetical protein